MIHDKPTKKDKLEHLKHLSIDVDRIKTLKDYKGPIKINIPALNKKKKGDPFDRESYKRGIAEVESSGGKFLWNKSSSATGKYQHLYGNIKHLKAMKGVTREKFRDSIPLQEQMMDMDIDNLIPKRPGAFRNATELTEEYKDVLGPKWNFRPDEVAALSHFLGRGGARSYFASIRDGKTFEVPNGENNKSPEEYLIRYNKGSGQPRGYGNKPIKNHAAGGFTDDPPPEELNMNNHGVGTEFVSNWMGNPVTQKLYADNMQSIGVDSPQPLGEIEAELFGPNMTKIINEQTLAKPFKAGLNRLANTKARVIPYQDDGARGEYNPIMGTTYYGTPSAGTAAHESVHAFSDTAGGGQDKKLSSFIQKNWGSPYESLMSKYEGKTEREAFSEHFGYKSPNSPETINRIKNAKYMNAEQGEIYPRVIEMREQLNVQPGEEVTPDMLQGIMNDEKIKNFTDYYDESTLLDMLNKTASTDMPSQDYSYAAYGGYTDSLFVKGGYTDEEKPLTKEQKARRAKSTERWGEIQNEIAQRKSTEQARLSTLTDKHNKAFNQMSTVFGAVTPFGMEDLLFSKAAPYVAKGMKALGESKTGKKVVDLVSEKAKELTNGKFSSQINWGDWNKEIPANKELMKEYYDIERKAKANGSFMKNPDGSDYKGHEEAWIQEQSKNFKKWYGDSKTLNEAGAPETFYHQSPQVVPFDTFDANEGIRKISAENHPNLIFTTPDANMASSYGSGHRYSLYGKSENPRSLDYAGRLWNGDKKIFRIQSNPNHQGAMYGPGENYSVMDYPTEEAAKEALEGFKGHEYYDNFVITNSYKGNPSRQLTTNNQAQRSARQMYDSFEAKNVLDYGPSVDVQDVIPSNTRVFFNPSNVKSRIGNNGMFDMTNPNMYKSVVPVTSTAVGAGTVLRNEETYAKGGYTDSVEKRKYKVAILQNWKNNINAKK